MLGICIYLHFCICWPWLGSLQPIPPCSVAMQRCAPVKATVAPSSLRGAGTSPHHSNQSKTLVLMVPHALTMSTVSRTPSFKTPGPAKECALSLMRLLHSSFKSFRHLHSTPFGARDRKGLSLELPPLPVQLHPQPTRPAALGSRPSALARCPQAPPRRCPCL